MIALHPLKAPSSIDVNVFGTFKYFSPVHLSNDPLFSALTDAGRAGMSTNPVHPLNVYCSIADKLVGMWKFFHRLLQSLNALSPMNLTVSGNENYDCRLEQPLNASFPIEETLCGTEKLVKALQFKNVLSSIDEMLPGSSTRCNDWQFANADGPIADTLDAMTMLDNCMQS